MSWVAVSEAATAHGKQQSMTRIARTITTVAMLSGGAAIAAPPAPNQLPTGGQVAAGIAAIGTNGNTMTVTQISDRAAINWNTFDIGSQAAVNFVQPSANAVALNRVNSPNPSQIYGQLSSNGQVYLINAAGVYFAPGAQVNVGGIVATTMQMSDAAFMAGSTTFERNGATGKVINEGSIQTRLNGYIAMLAPEVRNSGLLLAQAGTVAMAAGESITLNFGISSKLESITVTAGQLDTLVENRSAIKAPNGLVILSARAANQLAGSVVNSGTIEAKGVSQQGGRIVLEGNTVSNTGTLDASSDTAQGGSIEINGKRIALEGTIKVDGATFGGKIKALATEQLTATQATIQANSNQQGGSIQLAAKQVSLTDSTINADGNTQGGSININGVSPTNAAEVLGPNHPLNNPLAPPTGPSTVAITGTSTISTRSRYGRAGQTTVTGDAISLNDSTKIDATGATQGGTVLIGGDWQGSNGVYQATTVSMGQGVVIDASATDNGNGGKVVLWSDIHNPNSWTNVYGSIYAKGGANGGNGGKIETSGHLLRTDGVSGSAAAPQGVGGEWLFDPYNVSIVSSTQQNGAFSDGVWTPTNTGSQILNTSIQNLLNNGTSVTITTSGNGSERGDISVNAAISKTAGADATLTLRADGGVWVSNAITSNTGKLNVVLWSDYDNTNDAGVSINAQIKTNGGHLWSGGSSSASGSTTWNGLIVGNGPSVGSNTANWNGMDLGATINTQSANGTGVTGGDVLLWAGNGNPSAGVQWVNGIGVSDSQNIVTGSGNVTLLADYIFNYQRGGALSVTSTGTLTLVPAYGAQFPAAFTWAGTASGSNFILNNAYTANTNNTYNTTLTVNNIASLGGLTIGYYDGMSGLIQGNTGNVTVTSAISIEGPINIYSGNITLNAGLQTTRSRSGILAKTNGKISTAANLTFQTNNGSLVFWSNANGGSAGGISIGNRTILNTANGATTQTAGGGDVIIGGGSGSGAAPTGYAVSATATGVQFGADGDNAVKINSGGGNVSILGCSTATSGWNFGIRAGALDIRAGQGAVTISGNSSASHGVDLSYNVSTNATGLYVESSKTSGTAISITGVSTSASGYGVVFDWAGALKYLVTTGGGGISVTGSGSGSVYGISSQATHYLSTSGPIIVDGGAKGITFTGNAGSFGQRAGTNVTSSTANVTLIGDVIDVSAATTVNTTGIFAVESSANSFASAFTLPTNFSLASTLGGLTIGKVGNTANITLSSGLTLNGAINLYGGGLFVDGDLNAGVGNISLQGSGDVVVAGNVSTAGSFSATAGNTKSFLMGMNYASGAGTSITANAGFTLSAGTSYLTGNVSTTNAAISITGNISVVNLASNPSVAPIALNSSGGNISLTGGTVSAYSGNVSDYALLGLTKAKGITGSGVTLSTINVSGIHYLLYQFTNTGSDTFYNPYGVSAVDYLVTGGGGGGGVGQIGWTTGGGGGGGGVANGSYSLSGTAIGVAVGAGGTVGTQGGDSSFGTILVGGGGYGGNGSIQNSSSTPTNPSVGTGGAAYAAGGSGGGAGGNKEALYSGASGGTGTQRSGYVGGSDRSSDYAWGGGGGGAGGNGVGSGSLAPGSTTDGGAGISSNITGSSVTYGAGGGVQQTNGVANTGYGGGSSVFGNATAGSGTVIVRHALANAVRTVGSTLKLSAGAGAVSVGSAVSGLSSLEIASDGVSTISGAMSGSNSALIVSGAGTLSLTGTNTYSGTTNIVAGTLQIGNGTTNGSIANTSSIVNNGTLTFNHSDAVTLSKVISGTGNLTQTGSGTLTLSGANTYIGSTNVTAGTLAVSGSLADSTVVNVSSGAVYNVSVTDTIGSFTGDGTISVVAQHTLRAFGDNSDETFSGVIVGEGSLEKLGTGTLTLAGTNTYAGSTTISNGTLVIGGNGSLGSGTYGGFVVNNGNFIYNSTTNQSLSNRMSGTGNLTQNGTGTLTLSLDPLFNNTYTGNTTINGGVLRISSDGQLGNTTSQLVLNGGTLWTTANLTLNVSRSVILGANGGTFDQTTGTALTYAGVIDGAGSLNKVGMGTLTLSGANTYTGATNVSAGAFNVSGTLADTTKVNVSSGATYNVLSNDTIASFSGAGSITLGNGNTLTAFSDNSSASYGGDLSGAGGFTKAGTGTLTLTGTNTYTGTTTIDAGTLQLGDSGTTGSIAGSVVNNGMLVFNRSNAVTMNSSQIISGSGNLTQAGLGTLTLSGANTYSGITSINNGVLVISSDGNLGEAPVSATADSLVLNGGTLQTTANFSLNANRSISLGANGGTFLLNSSTLTYSGVIAGTGNLTKAGSGTLTLSGANTFSGITTIKSGNGLRHADALGREYLQRYNDHQIWKSVDFQ